MSMTLEQAMEGWPVTRAEATHEYEKHGLTEGELVRDLGDHDEYSSEAVLVALGW
jgi:hypothetical protein